MANNKYDDLLNKSRKLSNKPLSMDAINQGGNQGVTEIGISDNLSKVTVNHSPDQAQSATLKPLEPINDFRDALALFQDCSFTNKDHALATMQKATLELLRMFIQLEKTHMFMAGRNGCTSLEALYNKLFSHLQETLVDPMANKLFINLHKYLKQKKSQLIVIQTAIEVTYEKRKKFSEQIYQDACHNLIDSLKMFIDKFVSKDMGFFNVLELEGVELIRKIVKANQQTALPETDIASITPANPVEVKTVDPKTKVRNLLFKLQEKKKDHGA